MNSNKSLQLLLLAGAIYFFTVAIVHFLGVKIPIFYIYYDVESTIYQDRIISVLSFMFASFLYTGYKLSTKDLEIVKYIIFAGTIGVIGLALNNFLTRITFRTNLIYWIEIGLLGLYIVGLAIFYQKGKQKQQNL